MGAKRAINIDKNGCALCITKHYYKEGWQNFLPNTTSQIKATGVIEIYESEENRKL